MIADRGPFRLENRVLRPTSRRDEIHGAVNRRHLVTPLLTDPQNPPNP
jgi:hypothetical protein